MVCRNCGKELRDGMKFCDGCGTPVGTAPVVEESVLGTGKRRGAGLLVVGGIAVVAVIAAAVILLGGLFGGATGKVAKAALKSAEAYSATMDTFGVKTLLNLQEKQAFTQTIDLELKGLGGDLSYYADILKGIGVRMDLSTDIPGKKAGVAMSARYGSADLVSGYVSMEGENITVFLPEFMDKTALKFSTVTLGEDLENAGLTEYNEELEDISFNIFDMMDGKKVEPLDLSAANKALLKAVEVEKEGKEEKEVNGEDVDCVLYTVVIPEDAMLDYIGAVEDAIDEQGYDDMMVDMMESMGVEDYDIDDFKTEMKESMKEIFEGLEMAVEELGDVELAVYISGGYIMAVDYEIEIDGEKGLLYLQMGGGDNYVDDLSMGLETEYGYVKLESTGDHAAKSGTYTDETTFSFNDGWDEIGFKLETEYDTKAKDDNFAFTFDMDEVQVDLEGTLSVSGSAVSLIMDELAVDVYGAEMVTLSGEYTVKSFEKVKIDAKETLVLAKMDEDDIEDFVEEIEENAEDFVSDLEGDLGDLIYILQYML